MNSNDFHFIWKVQVHICKCYPQILLSKLVTYKSALSFTHRIYPRTVQIRVQDTNELEYSRIQGSMLIPRSSKYIRSILMISLSFTGVELQVVGCHP
uniref:Uncharacterized protein n=1 Tax=Electrophorus electricus TaxID=8005 RepID=A0AAY5EMP5_ELEEL